MEWTKTAAMAGSGKAHRFAAAFALLLLGLFLGICLGQAWLGRGPERVCRTIARRLCLAHGCRHISYETISHLRRRYPSALIEGHWSAKRHDRRDTGRSRWTWRLRAVRRAWVGQPQRRVEDGLRVFGILIMCDKASDFGGCVWLRSSCEVSSWVMESKRASGGAEVLDFKRRAGHLVCSAQRCCGQRWCSPPKGIPLWRAANGSRPPAGRLLHPKCGQVVRRLRLARPSEFSRGELTLHRRACHALRAALGTPSSTTSNMVGFAELDRDTRCSLGRAVAPAPPPAVIELLRLLQRIRRGRDLHATEPSRLSMHRPPWETSDRLPASLPPASTVGRLSARCCEPWLNTPGGQPSSIASGNRPRKRPAPPPRPGETWTCTITLPHAQSRPPVLSV